MEGDRDLLYYFNVRDGLKTLVASLEFSPYALELLQPALEKDAKLQEDFQKQKLYEGLVDYLHKSNLNAEGKTLDSDHVQKVLEILETSSLNEVVRESLSEKKKIKDLFLVVIKTVDLALHRKLVSSLIQFVSNLCYGTGKLRTMLRGDDKST